MKQNKQNTVFVFGSNLAGRHGLGAAKYAKDYHGAEYGVGRGRTGNAYALPTKDNKLRSLDWSEVDEEIRIFLKYAETHADELFLLTPVGCGLAGNDISNLINSLKKYGIPRNIVLTFSWLEYI